MAVMDGVDEVHKVTVARNVLKDYRPHEGVWPTEYLPHKRAKAREKFADVLRRPRPRASTPTTWPATWRCGADRCPTRSSGEVEVVGVDAGKVGDWLVAHVDGVRPPFTYELIAGGRSNLTYRVTDGGGRRFVLRRPPLSHVLSSAHDMGREHRIISALRDTAVPVPATLGLCTDESVNGAPFYVMEFVDGSILRAPSDVEARFDESQRTRRSATISSTCSSTSTRSTSTPSASVTSPGATATSRASSSAGRASSASRRHSRPRPGGPWATTASARCTIGSRALVPAQGPASIVHADYRLDNTMIGDDTRVAAVLDWELCTLGDPLADLGTLIVYWHDAADDGRGAHRGERDRDGGLPDRGPSSRRGTPSGPAATCRRSPTSSPSPNWRLACILDGVLRAARGRRHGRGGAPERRRARGARRSHRRPRRRRARRAVTDAPRDRRGARRRPARPHARARRASRSASRFRFLDPSPDAPAAAVGDLVVGALGDEARARGGARAAPTSSPTSGRAYPPTAARFLAASAPRAPGRPFARGVAGPAGREGDVPRGSGSAPPSSPAVDSRDVARRRGRRRSVSRPCSRPGAAATTARASACSAPPPTPTPRGPSSAAPPLVLEAFVPFDRELSVRGGARARRRDRVLAGGRERARATASSASSRAPAPGLDRRRCRHAAEQIAHRAARPSSTTSACSRSSCSTSAARCSPTRSRPACTTRATGRSRARSPASSRTTCARCSGSRSASTAARGAGAMVNCIGDDARRRRGARGAGRAPARLRQGAAPRPQARPRHRRRRRPPPTATPDSPSFRRRRGSAYRAPTTPKRGVRPGRWRRRRGAWRSRRR